MASQDSGQSRPPEKIEETRTTPDPSTLTTEQLEKGLHCLREVIEARLNGSDKISQYHYDTIGHRQEAIDREVTHLKDLVNEQLKGIDVRFNERDVRTDKTAELNQKAIDAALQAAKESVYQQNTSNALSISKSEAGMIKQIDGIITLMQATTKGLHEKIEESKSRVSEVQNRLGGMDGRARGMGDFAGIIVGAVGIVAAIAGIIIALNK